MGKRGRPKGHRLSQKSKEKISRSKTGQRHVGETKSKISKSLKFYFEKERNKTMDEKELNNADIQNIDVFLLSPMEFGTLVGNWDGSSVYKLGHIPISISICDVRVSKPNNSRTDVVKFGKSSGFDFDPIKLRHQEFDDAMSIKQSIINPADGAHKDIHEFAIRKLTAWLVHVRYALSTTMPNHPFMEGGTSSALERFRTLQGMIVKEFTTYNLDSNMYCRWTSTIGSDNRGLNKAFVSPEQKGCLILTEIAQVIGPHGGLKFKHALEYTFTERKLAAGDMAEDRCELVQNTLTTIPRICKSLAQKS